MTASLPVASVSRRGAPDAIPLEDRRHLPVRRARAPERGGEEQVRRRVRCRKAAGCDGQPHHPLSQHHSTRISGVITMAGAKNWTDEKVAQLKELWPQGLSCSQIARAIGGVSRNAVIGKINRLGLNGTAGARPKKVRQPRAPRAERRNIMVELEPLCATIPVDAGGHPEPLRLEDGALATVMTVTSQMCRWPHGDPRSADFYFCGCAPLKGSPYCAVHTRRAWQPHKTPEKADISSAQC